MVAWDRTDADDDVARVGCESNRGHDVGRQDEVDALRDGELLEPGRELELVVLHERLAHLEAACLEERERHPAAYDEDVHLLHQRLEDRDLGRNFGTTHDRRERALGMREGAVQVVELLLHQDAGDCVLHKRNHAARGCVRAVCCTERVVDEDGCPAGLHNRLSERGVVLFFLGVEARVLEE